MRKSKGFTLIELMIVIAIIAIIAAIAVPNLMQSRIRANEANMITVLGQYKTAQVTWLTGGQGDLASNAAATSVYADNYRNLTYGIPVIRGTGTGDATQNLLLLSRAIADAFAAGPITGAATTSTAGPLSTVTANAVPYQGYEYAEAKGAAIGYFTSGFALVGVPVAPGQTGGIVGFANQEGQTRVQGIGSDKTMANALDLDTPVTDGSAWTGM